MKDGKSGPLSKTDLEFLGYSKVDEHPPGELGLPERCRVFDATAPAGITSVRHWFIYPLTDCTNPDLENVASALRSDIFKGEICQIVVPKSLSDRNALTPIKENHFVHIFEDLMWNKIRQEFEPYMEGVSHLVNNLKAGIPYIEPSLSSKGASSSPIEHFINFFSGTSLDDNGVAIVNAEAGVGKTTLAVMVADRLVQQWEHLRIIPVLLTGQTSWRDLTELSREGASLWDVLFPALNLEGGNFPLNDETLFTRIMRQGYIAFIFDGFDELRSQYLSPRDNLAWLDNIAQDSSARLMVTARTSFWQREVETPEISHQVLKLKPFDRENARSYFSKHFEEEDDGSLLHQAMQLYTQLGGAANETDNVNFHFVELPACTAMIADYVKHGGRAPISDSAKKKNMIKEFFYGILEREQERQEISASNEQMLNVFGDVALSYDEFSMEDIDIAGAGAGLKHQDLTTIPDHAFLTRAPGGTSDKYRFKHEFLLYYLRASRIFAMLEDGEEDFVGRCSGDLLRLIHAEADGKGHLSEQMANFSGEPELQRFAKAHKFCTEGKVKSFFFHVIAKTAVALHSGSSRSERTKEIFNCLGAKNKQISNLFVEGTIADLSLKGWTIRDSHFSDLTLVRCDTNNLIFTHCRFTGNLDIPNRDGIQFDKNCTAKDGAKLVLSKISGAEYITEEDIRENLKTILRRFRPRNHFQPVMLRNWKTGKTKNIEERFDLLESMKQEHLVEEVQQNILQIVPSEIGEVRDFIDNGMLKGAVRAVFNLMKKNIGSEPFTQ